MRQGKIIDGEGTERWFKDGLLHREDGPAVIKKNGYKAWYKDGLRHREDGPAMINLDGSNYYYMNDKELKEKDYLEVLNCPIEELPLFINTDLAPIVRRRLLNETR